MTTLSLVVSGLAPKTPTRVALGPIEAAWLLSVTPGFTWPDAEIARVAIKKMVAKVSFFIVEYTVSFDRREVDRNSFLRAAAETALC